MVYWGKVKKLFEKTDMDAKTKVDVILLQPHASRKFHEHNFQWLTGIYHPVTCRAIITPDEMLILTTEQEHDYIQDQIGKDGKVTVIKPGEDPESFSKLLRNKKVGIDATQLPKKYFDEFTEMLGGSIKDPVNVSDKLIKDLVDVSDIFYELRATKDEIEIEKIRTAARICSSVRDSIFEDIGVLRGSMFKQLKELSEAEMYSKILSGLSTPIEYKNMKVFCKPEYVRVASGENTVLDHPEPTSRKLQPNSVVYLDIAGSYEGYCAFLSNFFSTGPSKEVGVACDTLNEVFNKAVELMVPGAKCRSIYHEVRRVLKKYKNESYFMGSPIGLEIHEPPVPNKCWIQPAPYGGSELQPNSVYWLIAGIHDPGKKWGIRLSETLLVKGPKCEILT